MSRIYLSPPHVSSRERELLIQAFDSNWIAPLGPNVTAFENEMAARVGRKYGCALSSGTAAIHLGLKILGVKEGDEVLVSTLTFSATVNPILYLGARPVFMDSESKTWNMDPNLLADELRSLAEKNRVPKAVVPVDLYGQCCDWDGICDACRRYSIPILEDSAEALGATRLNRKAGTFGDISIFSFNGNKIVTTGGGGMLMTDSEEQAKKVRFWATQARDPAPYYQHSEIGYNYRMSNLSAAVGRGQLEWLDKRVALRRDHFNFYREEIGKIPGIDFMPEPDGYTSTRWLTCLTVDAKKFGKTNDNLRQELEKVDIESRPIWKPMHLQPIFSRYRSRLNGFSETAFMTGLCLPSGSNLTREDQQRVIDVITGS